MEEENGGHDEPEVELDLIFGGTKELCIHDQQPHLVTMSNFPALSFSCIVFPWPCEDDLPTYRSMEVEGVQQVCSTRAQPSSRYLGDYPWLVSHQVWRREGLLATDIFLPTTPTCFLTEVSCSECSQSCCIDSTISMILSSPIDLQNPTVL